MKVFGKDCPLPSGIAWVPWQQREQGTLFPSAGYLRALTFPFSLMKNKVGVTQQISNTSLIPTWEAVELSFNYNSAFSMVKRHGDTKLTKANMICFHLLPINTFQVTQLSGNRWYLYSREYIHEGFIFSVWKRASN